MNSEEPKILIEFVKVWKDIFQRELAKQVDICRSNLNDLVKGE